MAGREPRLVEIGVDRDETLLVERCWRRVGEELAPRLLVQVGLVGDPEKRCLRVATVRLIAFEDPLEQRVRNDRLPGAGGCSEDQRLLVAFGDVAACCTRVPVELPYRFLLETPSA